MGKNIGYANKDNKSTPNLIVQFFKKTAQTIGKKKNLYFRK